MPKPFPPKLKDFCCEEEPQNECDNARMDDQDKQMDEHNNTIKHKRNLTEQNDNDTCEMTAEFEQMSSPSRQVCRLSIRKFILYRSKE